METVEAPNRHHLDDGGGDLRGGGGDGCGGVVEAVVVGVTWRWRQRWRWWGKWRRLWWVWRNLPSSGSQVLYTRPTAATANHTLRDAMVPCSRVVARLCWRQPPARAQEPPPSRLRSSQATTLALAHRRSAPSSAVAARSSGHVVVVPAVATSEANKFRFALEKCGWYKLRFATVCCVPFESEV